MIVKHSTEEKMAKLHITWNGVKGTYEIDKPAQEVQQEVLQAVAEKTMLVLPGGKMVGYLVLANSLVTVEEPLVVVNIPAE